MGLRQLILITTALFLTAAMLCSARDALAGSRLDVLPMTSIVRPYKLDPEDYDWQTVVQSHLNGQITHDAVFRAPTDPTEAVPVDCPQTQSIGVYFEVRTESKLRDQMRPFRFSWSHKDIDADEPVRSKFRNAWIVPRTQGVLLYSDHLELHESRRVNGVWRLQVFHQGEEIFREEFDLQFCERPYAPAWFRDNAVQTTASLSGAAGLGVSTAAAPASDDPLIADIDATIESIDSALNDYIREYLEQVELKASEFRSIERDLERKVRQQRKADPAAYQQIPETIHVLQAKVQFLQSAHPAFKDGRFPQAISEKFEKLSELEQRLRDEEAE